MHPGRLRFDETVGQNSYAWWYIDATSDDGRSGLTIIAFVGSVFSTYYAISRAFQRGDPHNHCSMNVSLWDDDRYCWGFTERGRNALQRSADTLVIGPSQMRWDGNQLTIDLDELNWPRMNRIRGRLRLTPTALTSRSVLLDTASWHRWWPVAPHARIEVDIHSPGRARWKGDAYLDHNAGHAPLENSFSSWTWSRARLKHKTAIFYDLKRRDQEDLSVALVAGNDGSLTEMRPQLPAVSLPRTRWRLKRSTRADEKAGARVIRSIEDGPFYARSLLETRIDGQTSLAMQESLSLDRLKYPWIRYMVLYRNPRAWFSA